MKHQATRLAILVISIVWTLAGCGADSPLDDTPDKPAEHTEPSDLIVVPERDSKGDDVQPEFNQELIVSDDFYLRSDTVDAENLQTFFENSPYGSRSWLADFEADDRSAAQMIIDVSNEFGVNPVLLLARLQVEQGLVSKTERPSQHKIDRALGCGCFDGQSCTSRFLGFQNQMRCSAESHRNLYNASVMGSGSGWIRGRAAITLEDIVVTPSNHATAALYAYTPWVLRGQGGNWLVWNITRRFTRHLEDLGLYIPQTTPFVGTPCTASEECVAERQEAPLFCLDFTTVDGETRGFCTLTCEGFCPDMDGRAATFCVEYSTPGLGICASKSEAANNECAELPGTHAELTSRFIGESGAAAEEATVCTPDTP